jgi:hypothetical protein
MFLVARRRMLPCALPCMTCLHGSSDCRAGLAGDLPAPPDRPADERRLAVRLTLLCKARARGVDVVTHGVLKSAWARALRALCPSCRGSTPAHFPAFAGCPIPRGTGTNPTGKGSNRHETYPRCCWTCIADHKLCVGSIGGQLRPNKTGRGPVRIRGCARARHADLRCRRGSQWRQMSRPRRARRAPRETPPGTKASLKQSSSTQLSVPLPARAAWRGGSGGGGTF